MTTLLAERKRAMEAAVNAYQLPLERYSITPHGAGWIAAEAYAEAFWRNGTDQSLPPETRLMWRQIGPLNPNTGWPIVFVALQEARVWLAEYVCPPEKRTHYFGATGELIAESSGEPQP